MHHNSNIIPLQANPSYQVDLVLASLWTSVISSIIQSIFSTFYSIFNFIKEWTIPEITVDSSVPYYDYMIAFFSSMQPISATHRVISNNFRQKAFNVYEAAGLGIYTQSFGDNVDQKAAQKKVEKTWLAGDKKHYFIFRKRLLIVSFVPGSSYEGAKFRISTPFSTQSFLNSIINEIRENFDLQREMITAYAWDSQNYRWDAKSLDRRPPESIILDEFVKSTILEDAEWFFANREFFKKKHIHYHRGYFFPGPAGTGKTSTAIGLATQLNVNIYMLSVRALSSVGFVNSILCKLPEKCIVLLEDLDRLDFLAAQNARNRGIQDFIEQTNIANGNMKSGLSEEIFQILLQVLDGVLTPEGVIFIITANDKSKINPVILREGRVDLEVEFHYATKWQAELMFLRFFPEEPDLAKQFAETLPENCITPAKIQKEFLPFIKKEDPLGASRVFLNYTPSESTTPAPEPQAEDTDVDYAPSDLS